ncbi:uncharacterized protein LOC106062690 isoform X2 [Biomphalaria glabrata]|uniref:Uncharacterized protein LOC106062690 isoform X2 n=1 Tax=Biomphalaria glabrata TaxID=6526 RepID=A0A9W2YJH0_BIOGL|nr:uncharacterized protein LOC106062690 isoform X2 [Biomphalaria glabrata]
MFTCTCWINMSLSLTTSRWEMLKRPSKKHWGSRCYRENSLRTTGAYIKERTRSRSSVCPVSTALEPAKQSDLHLGKYRVSSMLSEGDVPKDVGVSDWCPTGDLAQVQRTVCSATGLVSSLTLTKTWLQTIKGNRWGPGVQVGVLC